MWWILRDSNTCIKSSLPRWSRWQIFLEEKAVDYEGTAFDFDEQGGTADKVRVIVVLKGWLRRGRIYKGNQANKPGYPSSQR